MAQFDLKKAKLKVRDGTAGTAQTNAVDNVAGYAKDYSGAIAYDGIGVLAVGMIVTLGGEKYSVKALGSGTVTFHQPLADAVDDDDVISSTVYANEVTLKIGAGNLTYSEKRNVEYTLDAGVIDEVRLGDEVPMDVSVDCTWVEYSGSGVALEDSFSGTGTASAWASSDTDACRPYAVDLIVEYIPPCGGGIPNIITLPDFRWEEKSFDLKGGTFSVKGKCNAKNAILS